MSENEKIKDAQIAHLKEVLEIKNQTIAVFKDHCKMSNDYIDMLRDWLTEKGVNFNDK